MDQREKQALQFADKELRGAEARTHKIIELETKIDQQSAQIRSLEKERLKLSTLANNTKTGFLIVNKELKITWSNKIISKWFAKEDFQIIDNMPCRELLYQTGKDCPDICPIKKASSSGDTVNHDFTIGTGSDIRTIYMTAMPMKAKNENIADVLVMLQDISDFQVLRQSKRELENNEGFTKALFNIANAVNVVDNLNDLYKSIHKSLSDVIDANNFYIAIYDDKKDILSFPYISDIFDGHPPPIENMSKSSSLTCEVIQKCKPLFFKKDEMIARAAAMNLKVTGTPSELWLGVPLKTKDHIIGAIVVQSYNDSDIYSNKDMDLLTAISDQVATAIDKKRQEGAKTKSEKLNKVLFAISNAVNTTENLDELYNSIYNSLNQLKTLPNFYICIVEEEKKFMHFPFYIDEFDQDNLELSVHYNEKSNFLTIDVIKSKKPVLLDKKELEKRHSSNKATGTQSEVWLGVPLLIRGRVIGVMAVQHYSDPHYFTHKDVDLFVAVSDQIAIAIDRKRSQEELKNSEKFTKTIFKISNAVNTTDNLEDLFASIHQSLNFIIDASNFFIAIYDRANDTIAFPYHVDLLDNDTLFSEIKNSRKSISLTSEVIQKNRSLFFKKNEVISRAKAMNMKVAGSLPELWLGVPLRIKNNVIGAIVIQSYDDPDIYNQKDLDLLIAVSDQVALAIERKRAQDAQKKSEELNKVLFAISNAVNTTRNIKELCDSIHNSLKKVIYVENFSLSLYDQMNDQLDLIYSCDKSLPVGSLKNASKSNAMTFKVIRQGHPLLMDEKAQYDLAEKFGGEMIGNIAKSWLCVPLKIKDETIGAILTQDYENENCYKTKDIELLTLVSDQIALAIDRKRSQEIILDHQQILETTVKDRTKKLTNEIAERIQIEKRLKQAKIAAEAAARSKGEFLANMSHEIRTPINGIMGMAEIALEDNLNENLKPIIETIDTEANALLAIVNQILDFSKIEAGKLALEEIPFNLRNTFEQACSSLAIGVDEKKVEFISFLAPDVPIDLIGDPGRLRQVLVNLTSNAIKFTRKGEIFVKGEKVKDTKSSVELRFLIKDTGIGIPREKHQEIFEGFTQADGSTTRKYGGTGLGTTISKQLTELMGGKIGVESTPGKGSTFWFTAKFKKQKNIKLLNPINEMDFQGIKVLVTDDYKSNQYVFTEYLKSFGATPIPANKEKDIFKILEKGIIENNPVDLIIAALERSPIDGFELSKKIRKRKEFSKLPIIMVTSSGSIGDGSKCKNIGIDSYLLKPVKQGELKTAIIRILQRPDYKLQSENKLITRHTIAEEKANNLKILLVEDYPTNQKVALRHLNSEGYHVTLADNGKIAVDLYKKHHFDLILMDIQMPVMDGYKATLLIRKHEAKLSDIKICGTISNSNCRVPIIAMTAHALEGYKDQCIKADMDDFISKPIRKEKLLKITNKWLGQIRSKALTPPIDYNTALDEFDNDKEFLDEVIYEFLKTVGNQIKQIEIAINAEDYGIIQKEAHSIKGGASNLMTDNLSKSAHELEIIGKAKDSNNVLPVLDKLKIEFDLLKTYMEKIE